jgi:hypothetical protein
MMGAGGMLYWMTREELSLSDRLRRSYYELLRDQLDQWMVEHALIRSYRNFVEADEPYPFVEKRELKPKARIPDVEYPLHQAFLVMFVEDIIPDSFKKYIRFFNENITTKSNLQALQLPSLPDHFNRTQKYLESAVFPNVLEELLPIDYALLIQRDPASRKRNRYQLSHFHVRIDYPIAKSAEELALRLRYISKDLFERGEKYAEDLQKKFFEYYGMSSMAGGRRTAAIVAAQYLRKLSCISTVYVGSSAYRGLMRIGERHTAKMVLMTFSHEELGQIAAENGLDEQMFRKNYLVDLKEDGGVCIVYVAYSPSNAARPPEDGKLRKLRPELSWLTISCQQILPKPGVRRYPPLSVNWVYS